MRNFLAFTGLIFASCATATQLPTRNLAAEIVGSWQLVSYEDRDSNGLSVYPYGRSPAGLIIYDGNGNMAVQIMRQPPPAVSSDDWDKFTAAEKVALWDGYVAYFGRYEVDARNNAIIHLPEADLSRLYIGKREIRHPTISGDTLILTETWEQGGRHWSGIRRFHRLRAAASNTR